MKYVIDIDGTICEQVEVPNWGTGEVYYDRIKKINKLYLEGHTIVYYTARGMGSTTNPDSLYTGSYIDENREKWYDYTAKQLKQWGCLYTTLHLGKYSGDIYIDDKGVNSEVFFNSSDKSTGRQFDSDYRKWR
jgi:hypothetical protein